jgi:hydroxymethylglutaryl-CoA lyase
MKELKIIECPRDAMQGLHDFIPTEKKITYLNQLLKCNFDTLDFGSFVSPKAIPQLADTEQVLQGLNLDSQTKLLAIVANERGALQAAEFDPIRYLGFPFSVSETFQQRNTNSSILESFKRVEEIQNICARSNKELVLYLSMGFGNPYGDAWSADIVAGWSEKLYQELGVKIQALSDTIGIASPSLVHDLFKTLIEAIPEVEFGAHLHTIRENAQDIVAAAFQGGCRRFDGAIKGFGGCPMAKDDLTGNMPTELMLDWFNKQEIETYVDHIEFEQAMLDALGVFPL